jgi:hypothetical protein
LSEKEIPINEAKRYIKNLSIRLALLHLAFSKAIVEELGEKNGMELIAKAIRNYGKLVGKRVKRRVIEKGLEPTIENWPQGEDLPDFGMYEKIEGEEEGYKIYGCILADIWREYGEEKLGRIYCYIDPVKSMAYNPRFKLVHLRAIPDGCRYCEFTVRPTSHEERKLFAEKDNILKILKNLDKP